MNAYLIDPFQRAVTLIEYSGQYEDIYKHIEPDLFDVVEINRHRDCVFIDDEGLINGKPQEFFLIRGYPQPLAGYGLVLGTDAEGNTVAPTATLDEVFEQIGWLNRDELIRKYA
jgi:hypothetical protein